MQVDTNPIILTSKKDFSFPTKDLDQVLTCKLPSQRRAEGERLLNRNFFRLDLGPFSFRVQLGKEKISSKNPGCG